MPQVKCSCMHWKLAFRWSRLSYMKVEIPAGEGSWRLLAKWSMLNGHSNAIFMLSKCIQDNGIMWYSNSWGMKNYVIKLCMTVGVYALNWTIFFSMKFDFFVFHFFIIIFIFFLFFVLFLLFNEKYIANSRKQNPIHTHAYI